MFKAADLLVSPHLLLLRGSVTLVDGQCDGSFWVILKMKTSKKGVRIFLKMSTGLSLNSCVDCKVSISVTSKALEIFSVI